MKKLLLIISTLIFLSTCTGDDEINLSLVIEGEGAVLSSVASGEINENEAWILEKNINPVFTVLLQEEYEFDGWYLNDELYSQDETIEVNMNNEDTTLKVVFTEKTPENFVWTNEQTVYNNCIQACYSENCASDTSYLCVSACSMECGSVGSGTVE
ncbi:MAG: hypothetical protein ABIA04_08020 [Pseudomonadota bacterium]